MRFRQQPGDILKNLGIYEPEEIDLDLVAFSLGANVKRTVLSDCEGYIIGTDERAIITINNNVEQTKQTFSLGHEIGHWVNDRRANLTYRCTQNDMRQKAPIKDNFRQQKEVRANSFSSQLIMPDHIALPYIEGMEISFDTVKYLADLFSPSLTSAAIRLVEVSPFPCMLTCWNPSGQRRWFKRNPILPDWIWPHREITYPKSAFRPCNALEVDANFWISHESSSDYTVIQSVFSNSYDVLALLWWKDESQLL